MTDTARVNKAITKARNVLDTADLDSHQLAAVHHAVTMLMDEVPYAVTAQPASPDVFAVVRTQLDAWEQVMAALRGTL